MKLLSILIVILSAFFTQAQVYSNQSTLLGINAVSLSTPFGSGISYYDFDSDNDDDLTFALGNEVVFYENDNGDAVEIFPGVSSGNSKHPVWVDYDDDGDMDFFVTQYFEQNKLYQNNGSFQFTEVASIAGLQDYSTPHFGCSWGDYDRDGDLDVFVCNYVYQYQGPDQYNYANHLYRNNGNGSFEDVTLASGAYSGIEPSFQSVWLDYNNDLWPDLYVINDKWIPNRLYSNNGNGTFTNIAEISGTAIPLVDAMTASCADFNNDGFEDIFVSNTSIGPCAMLKNNGDSSFTDIAGTAGTTLEILAWAGNWFDYDLDTDQDLYICENFPPYSGIQNKFLKNNGNEVFFNVNPGVFPFDFSDSYTCASGDWNSDGYPDLAVNNYSPQNANCWMSAGGDKYYLKVSLEGVISNKQGIGSWVTVYSNGILQTKYTKCGENYMGQNSGVLIFGLDTFDYADSLVVKWPSGHIDKFYDAFANQQMNIVEGSGFVNSITFIGNTVLCPGDSVMLDAGDFAGYLWSDGSTGQYLQVDLPGQYSVLVTSVLGFESALTSVEVVQPEIPSLDILVEATSCYGLIDGNILIATENTDVFFVWENGDTTSVVQNLSAGIYNWNTFFSSGCVLPGSAVVSQPDSLYADYSVNGILCAGQNTGTIELINTNAIDFSLQWSNGDAVSTIDSLETGNYSYLLTDSTGCSISGEVEVSEPPQLEITSSYYTYPSCFDQNDATVTVLAEGGTGELDYYLDICDYSEAGFFENVAPGCYQLYAVDENGCQAYSEIVVPSYPQIDIVIIQVQPASCAACDDGIFTANIFGGMGSFTFTLNNELIDFESSLYLVPGAYTFCAIDANGCDLCETFEIDFVDQINSIKQPISIYPNPTISTIFMDTKLEFYSCSFIELTGKSMPAVLVEISEDKHVVDISMLDSGAYLLHMETKLGDVITWRFVKLN